MMTLSETPTLATDLVKHRCRRHTMAAKDTYRASSAPETKETTTCARALDVDPKKSQNMEKKKIKITELGIRNCIYQNMKVCIF
jgi:hypothetical protein